MGLAIVFSDSFTDFLFPCPIVKNLPIGKREQLPMVITEPIRNLFILFILVTTPLTQSEAAIPLHKRSGGVRDFLPRFSPSPLVGEGVGG